MDNLFIPYKIALLAKKKGFSEPCLAKWMLLIKGDTIPRFTYNYEREARWFDHNNVDTEGLNGNGGDEFLWSAPLYQQMISWLNVIGYEQHLDIYIVYNGLNTKDTTDFEIEEALNLLK